MKKHHFAVVVLITIGIIAWAVWTFWALPASESPNLPDPAAQKGTPLNPISPNPVPSPIK